MSSAIGLGLPATLGSAAMYGVAPLVQAMAARREQAGHGLGFGLLARLALRPLWLLGLTVETAAFLLEVYALSVAPVAMVGPMMALDMVVFTTFAGRVLREHVSRVGVAAICSMVAGVGLLAYAFEEHGSVGQMASTHVLLLFLGMGMVFALAVAVVADKASVRGQVTMAALGFGTAAGVAYAIATLATRQFGLALDERRSGGAYLGSYLLDLLRTPAPYLLVVFSLLAMSLEQRGLQGRAAVLAFPVTSGVSAFLPVVLGLTIFEEPAPRGIHFAAFIGALLLIAAAIAGLARDRAIAVEASTVDPQSASPAAAPTAAGPATRDSSAGADVTRGGWAPRAGDRRARASPASDPDTGPRHD